MATTHTLKRLAQVVLGVADTLVYTCPALTRTTVSALYKCNTDGTNRTFRLHQVPSGGAIAVGNALYYDEPITANRLHPRVDIGLVLEPGQMLRGLASAAVVTVTVFGIESTEG